MPLLGSSILVGRQNTQPHCSGTFTGYVYWSESSFGCVFWHIIVCMAQHRRILQTACGRHQSLSPVAIFALPTRLRCWCRQLRRPCSDSRHVTAPYKLALYYFILLTRRVTLGDRAFPVVAAWAWNSLPVQIRAAHRCCLFDGRQRPIFFSCRTTDFWLLPSYWIINVSLYWYGYCYDTC